MVYTFEDFELDIELYELRRNGERIPVEPQVFDVITYLLRHRDRVVSKQELFENIWETRFVTESALTSRIKAARRALDDGGREQRLIGTVHGRGYRFLGRVEERDSSPPSDRRRKVTDHTGGAGMLVGRERELRRLNQLLADALRGSRRTVVLTGEAGIGKTTTIEAFLHQAHEGQDVLVTSGQCLEHHGPTEPYMPIFDALDRLFRSNPELNLVKTLALCGPSWLMEMPWLVDDDELATIAHRTVGNTRLRMLREVVETFVAISEIRPLVLVIEDLQWSDPSTLDALNALARSPIAAHLLILCSCRTSEVGDPGHPATSLLHGLQLHGLCEELALAPLTEAEVDEYVHKRLPGITLSEGSVPLLHARSDGNPLFVQILVNDFKAEGESRQSDVLTQAGAQIPTRVPATLRRMIEQRVVTMSKRKQEVLQTAAVAGIEASPTLIARLMDAPEEEIEEVCSQLARTDQFLRPDEPLDRSSTSAKFVFAHGLYQEVVYEAMPSARRARLHGAVGRALEASYGSRVAERAGEVAFHFGRAGEALPTVKYLQIAAGQALRRYAYREAVDQLTSAMQLIEGLEAGQRIELEIAVCNMLALALVMVEGWSHPEIELLLKRALVLSESLGDPDRQSLLLYHLAAVYENLGQHEKSKEVLERRLLLHPEFTDSTSLLESHELLACSLFHKGEFAESLDHADRGSRLYDPERHLALLAATVGENLGVSCHSWAALDLWYLGFPGRAKQRMAAALEMAKDPEHAYCLAQAEERAAILYQLLGEPKRVLSSSTAAIDLARQQGHELCVVTGHILRGWARSVLGEVSDGEEELGAGLASYKASGTRIGLPYYLGLVADASLLADRVTDALAAVGEALSIVGGRGYSHEAELHRLRGLALARLGQKDGAISSLRRAVEVARGQNALSLELRALETLAENAADPEEATAARRALSLLKARQMKDETALQSKWSRDQKR
ncbi:MAG TPA: AAA family ATPase [Gemmatimonadales bacterium]|nr:AAA family ATPase [Gemmatimonadales bacterium]